MKNQYLPLLTAVFVLMGLSAHTQIMINEYSAANLHGFTDNFGKTEDWIELYNAGNTAVDLGGWHLSDKEDKPTKWQIPEGATIAANGLIRFWCSGRDTTIFYHRHTNFKLSQTKGNEYVVLADPDGNIIESHFIVPTAVEHSHARAQNGSDEWKIDINPTLGASNTATGMYDGYTNTPELSLEAGFYADSVTVSVSADLSTGNGTLHYTLDGTLPTENSPEYSGPITVHETTVIKVAILPSDSNILPGRIAYATYFINEDFTLPVFSVAADQLQQLAGGQGTIIPIGSLEYFNADGEMEGHSYGDLNRHGQDSWVLPHRSLDWVSRDEMGYNKAVDAKLFESSDRTEFQRFMFRASGDDNYPAINDNAHEGSCHVRDEYVHTLALEGGMDLDVRRVQRVIVFLNGDYWGVYGLRERPVDHDYTDYYYDQDKYSIQYLSTWGNTTIEYGGIQARQDWEDFRDFVLENDMSDSTNYAYVTDNLRVLSLIDYMIANLNSVASDWLNYNTGWWRGLDPDGDHKKWGYILWDNDATFDYYINYSGVPNTDPDAVPCDLEEIADYMDDFFGNGTPESNNDVGKHEKIFLKLLEENADFRQLYYGRQADLMNTVYSCENMVNTLNEMIGVIQPEMPRQIDRWGGSMGEWTSNVQDLYNFINQRCNLVDNGLVSCYDLTGPYNITLMTEPPGIGEIDFNTLDLEELPWSGDYFGGMENRIKTKAFDEFEDEYEFSHWVSASGNAIFPDSLSRRARIVLTQPDTLIAVYAQVSGTADPLSELGFSVFPNPTDEQLRISFELEQSSEIAVHLTTVTGQRVATVQELSGRKAAGYYEQQVDLKRHGIAPGVYFLSVTVDGLTGTRRVVVL